MLNDLTNSEKFWETFSIFNFWNVFECFFLLWSIVFLFVPVTFVILDEVSFSSMGELFKTYVPACNTESHNVQQFQGPLTQQISNYRIIQTSKAKNLSTNETWMWKVRINRFTLLGARRISALSDNFSRKMIKTLNWKH